MFVKIEKIFCPVDLRSETPQDLLLPLWLARKVCGAVFFCYCTPSTSADQINSERRRLHKMVEEALRLASSGAEKPPDWEALVFKSRNAAGTIASRTANGTADLIMLRSSRFPPVKALLLGSVAETLSRTAPCSVLITRPAKSQPQTSSSATAFRRILTAYDFSDHAELALQHAALLGEKLKAELSILHVLAGPLREESELMWTNSSASSLYHQTVGRLQTALAAETPVIRQATAAVRWGKSYREILRYADEQQIDLIAMGAHGADFGTRSLFGSNVDRVLRQASQAVLIARPLKPAAGYRLRKISRHYA